MNIDKHDPYAGVLISYGHCDTLIASSHLYLTCSLPEHAGTLCSLSVNTHPPIT